MSGRGRVSEISRQIEAKHGAVAGKADGLLGYDGQVHQGRATLARQSHPDPR